MSETVPRIIYTSISSARIVGYEHDAIRVGWGATTYYLGLRGGSIGTVAFMNVSRLSTFDAT